MLKALIFDMDGTLADSDPVHLRAFAEFLAPFGVTVDEEVYRSTISGRTNALIFADLLPHHTPADHERFARRRKLGRTARVDDSFTRPSCADRHLDKQTRARR